MWTIVLIFCEPTILLNLYKQQITTEPHKQRLGCHLIPSAENSPALPLKFLLLWLLWGLVWHQHNGTNSCLRTSFTSFSFLCVCCSIRRTTFNRLPSTCTCLVSRDLPTFSHTCGAHIHCVVAVNVWSTIHTRTQRFCSCVVGSTGHGNWHIMIHDRVTPYSLSICRCCEKLKIDGPASSVSQTWMVYVRTAARVKVLWTQECHHCHLSRQTADNLPATACHSVEV